jgi:serine/threonine-protein kinase
VAAIRLDARKDVIPPPSDALELSLEPGDTYRLSEPTPPTDSPPLFFWLSGPGLPAKDGVGVLSQRPIQIKGAASFKAFALSPLPAGAVEREVLVENLQAKTRKRVVISLSAAASTEQAFELKNLDPASSYRLMLVTLEPGAYTRGEQAGPLDQLACVRLSSTEQPATPQREQQFLLRAGTSVSLSGASSLLCGVIDDDPTNNEGELQISIIRTSGGPEWASPSPYTLVTPAKSGEIKTSFEQAMRLFQAKQFDRAAIFAERCISLAPNDADCHLLAGATYASIPGQQDKAAQHYRLFLEMAPTHPRIPQIQRHLAELAP